MSVGMALAQGTGVMLPDEPTTYRDRAHQVEVLDLLAVLNRRQGRNIVLVSTTSTRRAAAPTTSSPCSAGRWRPRARRPR